MEIIITGDLNCNFLELPKSQVTFKLADIMNIYQLQQHIRIPTTVSPITSSLIDVMFTYMGDNKTLETGVIPFGISDHNLVYICRKISLPKELPKIVLSRQYKRYNVNAFNHDLIEIFIRIRMLQTIRMNFGVILKPNFLLSRTSMRQLNKSV